MWLINKSLEEQELINKAISKAGQKSNKRLTEGRAVKIALEEYIKR